MFHLIVLLFNHLSANVVYILFIYNSNRILTDEKRGNFQTRCLTFKRIEF